MRKQIFLCCILLILCLICFCACSEKNPLVGTWTDSDGDIIITFTSKGTWYSSSGDAGNYEVDGSTIISTEYGWPDADVSEFFINGDFLYLGDDLILTRVN